MDLAKSQEKILQRLKTRGEQSVKILSNQLDMTTMGVRQHLAELENKGFVTQTREEKQTRGRPVHLWRLTQTGHQRFPDGYPRRERNSGGERDGERKRARSLSIEL